MQDVRFRACTYSDIGPVQQLVQELYNTDPIVEGLKPSIGNSFAEFMKRPDKGKVVVFEYNQQVVGYAIIVFVWNNQFASDLLSIDEMVVNERYRSLGIGKKFFSWLQQTYTTLPALFLLVSEYNPRAKKFYEEIGFKPLQLQMLKINVILEEELSTNIRNKEFVEAA